MADLPIVVGLGASAGGLEPLVSVFESLRSELNAAFVVVQHLSTKHRSLMKELLGRRTALPVEVIEDGVEVECGRCYLMPAGMELRLEGSRLRLEPADRSRGVPAPIDTFFESLAGARAERAIAIVLSGTGSDGTRGSTLVREAGGKVIVQRPASAQFDGMPLSVIEQGIAHYVCEPTELPGLLTQLLESRPVSLSRDDLDPWVVDVAKIVRNRTGLDLTEYKSSTLVRRLERRLEMVGVSDHAGYVTRLAASDDEVEFLIESLLIDVTSFFRDKRPFTILENEVIPRLLDTAPPDRDIRIWCAGCASGHEAYSIAILMKEALASRADRRSFKIFATDASRTALTRAGSGIYEHSEIASLSPERIERHFVAHGSAMRVVDSLRLHLVFAQHNLQRDPPFTNLDLLSCRNVLIYFRPELQERVLSVFKFALRPDGYLFLGDSETVGDRAKDFETTGAARDRIYQSKGPRTGFAQLPRLAAARVGPVPPLSGRQRVIDLAQREIARSLAPATALVDRGGNVEHLFGDTRPFLQLPTGAMTRRLDQLARAALAPVTTSALAKARRSNGPIVHAGVNIDGLEGPVRVSVRPLPKTQHFLVSYNAAAPTAPALRADAANNTGMRDLHEELVFTRENLQSTIEDLQSANEELQTVNEEMVASNEELQATNEELHATTEELRTVSSERQERINELVQLNADVETLLVGAEFGTIFLDGDLRIRKFSGPIDSFVQLLPQDIGRPVGHFANTISGLDLEAVAKKALITGRVVEQDDARTESEAILVRAVPFTQQTTTEGVVLSFLNITSLKEAETRLEMVLNSLAHHVAVLEQDGTIAMVNDAWRSFANDQGGRDFVGENYLAACDNDPSAQVIAQAIRDVLRGEKNSFAREYPCDTPSHPLRFQLHVTPLESQFGVRRAVVSHLDITRRVFAEREVETLRRSRDHLFERNASALLVVDTETSRLCSANAAATKVLRRSKETLLGVPLPTLVPESRWDAWQSALKRASESDDASTVLELLTGDGAELSMLVNISPPAGAGTTTMLVELQSVVTGSATGEDRPSQRSQRLESLGTLAGGVAHEMNNVLAGIMGVVESWASDENLTAPLRDDLSDVLAACHRGRDVTRNLLGFARADSPVEAVRLSELIAEVVVLAQRAAGPGIAIESNVEPDLVLRADRSQLVQALLNLSLNGIDAMKGTGGTLRVSAARTRGRDEGSLIAIEVSDDGTGMSAGVRARAFEPFFTTKPRGEGTGLGLPMVYGLVRTLGGQIEIKSEEGKGTTIALSLPSRGADRPKPHTDVEPLASVAGSVLLVDDDDLVRSGIASTLRRHGLEVTEKSTAEDALTAAFEDDFLVVILDVVMPGMGGLEALSKLRARKPEAAVILLSGYPELAEPQLKLEGRTAFMYKPVTTRELLERIASLASDDPHARNTLV